MPTEWVAVRVVSRADVPVVPFIVYSIWLVEGVGIPTHGDGRVLG